MKNYVRYHQALQEFLQHTLVTENPLAADAEVDDAFVAFFNEKYRLGCSSSAGDILLGAMCHYFPGSFLTTLPSCPPGLEAPPPAEEPGPSCVVLVDSADSVRPTAEVQNICDQRHGRVVLSLVRELALDCNSSQPRKAHGTRLQLQLSRLLGGVEQSDRGDKVGRLYPTTGGIQHTAQRTVHRRRPGYPNTEGDKGRRQMEVGPQRASTRASSTAPQIVPPSASDLPSLCAEMRKRIAQGNFRLHSEQQCSNASSSVNQFLPRRPRGACFVVLSSAACKVGRKIRHRGFLDGWYHLSLDPRIFAGSLPIFERAAYSVQFSVQLVPPGSHCTRGF